jgi:hypothetical protein
MQPRTLFTIIAVLPLQFVCGCIAETQGKEETNTIFDPQIQALEKAKQTEDFLKQAEQERRNKCVCRVCRMLGSIFLISDIRSSDRRASKPDEQGDVRRRAVDG